MGDPFKLIIEDDEGKRNVVPVELGEVSVGRLETNAIRLNERNVSRNHMRLAKENGSVVAEDLNSYNGVYINGSRITQRQLIHEGDLIRVGDFHLELRGEGLARRAEETTQKTLVPDLDSTQPGVKEKARTEKLPVLEPEPAEITPPPDLESSQPEAGSQASEPDTPPPARARPSTPAAPGPEEEDEEEERPEPTAIIRLDQLQALEEAKDKRGIISSERPKLICVSTSFAGKEFEIATNEAVIGRTPDNEVSIDHRSVSRHHAKIVAAGGGFKIVDLGSANGTLVNGEQYAQLALKAGDLIELGHVRFRFLPPGASYSPTPEERAAIKGEETQVLAQVPQAPPVAQAPPVVQVAHTAQGGETSLPTRPKFSSDRRGGLTAAVKANPFGAIGAAAALVGVAIIVVWVLTRGDGAGGQGTRVVEQSVGRGGSADGAGAAKKWIERAQKAIAERDWGKAKRYADKALEKEPDNDAIIGMYDTIETEAGAAENLKNANDAIAEENWEAAHKALKDIDDESVYAEERDGLITQVKRARITSLEAAASEAAADGNESGAREAIAKIEELDPEHEAIARLNALLDGGAASDTEPSSADSSSGKKPQKSPGRSKPPKKPVKKPEEARPAPPPPAPPKKEAPKKGDPTALYKKGIALLQGGQTQPAIDAFNACVQADRAFCLCYRALGIAHARGGNGPKAARYYRLYLKACPTAKDAPQVEKLLKAYGL